MCLDVLSSGMHQYCNKKYVKTPPSKTMLHTIHYSFILLISFLKNPKTMKEKGKIYPLRRPWGGNTICAQVPLLSRAECPGQDGGQLKSFECPSHITRQLVITGLSPYLSTPTTLSRYNIFTLRALFNWSTSQSGDQDSFY